MDMDMGSMSSDGGGGFVPLNDSGVDFSNETQAQDFLSEILDDSYSQVVSNQYARYFWYGIVVFIGIAAICNFSWRAILRARLRKAAANRAHPARPTNIFTTSVSTLTAVTREASYLQITPDSISSYFIIPPFGTIAVILLYFGFLLALEFTNNNYPGAQHDQALGLRAGWLAVAQVPLLILLAGKVNIIGLVSGVSYERLNVYHRWVARGLLLLASMHFGFQSRGWNNFGLIQLEWDTDTCPPTGMAAYALLLWMNLTTLAPFRKMSYKFFVVQHILVFIGFIVALMEHLPSTALYSRVYVWIPIGFYLFDRTVRSIWYLWNNASSIKTRMQPLDNTAVKLRISSKNIKTWSPGSHFRLRFPRFGFWHTHPAGVLSMPSSHDGDLVFILKARGWLTRRLLQRAELFSSSEATKESGSEPTCTTLVGGPYASSHSDFAAFDTLLLIAGGSGVTFTLSTLLDLAHRATLQKLPLRTVDFVWIVKEPSWVSWIAEELKMAYHQLHEAGIEIRIQVFLTCATLPARPQLVEEKDTLHCTRERSGAESPTHSVEREGAFDHLAAAHPSVPIEYRSSRPKVVNILASRIETAKGESAVGVCGPMSLRTAVRTAVVRLSDERAVHKGTGAQGIYLHVANTDYS
ncbi:MAG: hypothetical protein M1822_007319 [Bathelium mastoideum]|nr:MAG: hypothetical protein M1822_007319 [Bathelium mastoideum]